MGIKIWYLNGKTILFAVLLCMMGLTAGCTGVQKEADDGKVKTEEPGTNKEMSLENQETDSIQDNLLDEIEDVSEYEAEYEEEEEEERSYDLETYGETETIRKAFSGEESGELAYYYEMEKFFVKDSFANASSLNSTLQLIYDEYEAAYLEDTELYQLYQSGLDEVDLPYPEVPYNFLHILAITYAGDDYISILYNDICYMGGAHPYSRVDGITLDCKTGEQVPASRFLEKSEEEILAEISNTMGFDSIGTWEDIDFHLTDSTIVFFYRMPGIWEDVTLRRAHETEVW